MGSMTSVEVAQAVAELGRRRLLQLRGGGGAEWVEVRLHDLQRGYVRQQTSVTQQRGLHKRLLNRYRSVGAKSKGGSDCEWWDCVLVGRPDAAFFCTWLCFHILESCTGACTINRPCAQQYVGKSQSCMVENGRLIPHASYRRRAGGGASAGISASLQLSLARAQAVGDRYGCVYN